MALLTILLGLCIWMIQVTSAAEADALLDPAFLYTSPPPAVSQPSPLLDECPPPPSTMPPACHHCGAVPASTPPQSYYYYSSPPPASTPVYDCESPSMPPVYSCSCTCDSCSNWTRDAQILNTILSVEYLLADCYSQASASSKLSQDLTVQTLTKEFFSGTTRDIESLAILLKENAEQPKVAASRKVYARIMNAACGGNLVPDFNAYGHTTNFLLAVSVASPLASKLTFAGLAELESKEARAAVVKIASALASQNAALHVLLLQRKDEKVLPYDITVQEFSDKLVELQRTLNLLHGSNDPLDNSLFSAAVISEADENGVSRMQSLLADLGFYPSS